MVPIRFLKHFPARRYSIEFSASDGAFFLDHHLIFLSNRVSTIQSLFQFHALAVTSGNSNNLFIASKLISLYATVDKPFSSFKIFNSVYPRDTFLWNSIVKSYFSSGKCSEALYLYSQMQASSILPNQFTLPMVATACAQLMLLDYGKNVHGLASKLGLFAGNSAVGSSFVFMYSKCGQMTDASVMFDEILVRDVVAWTALVIGYVQNNESKKAWKCLCEMHRTGENCERPNFRTLEGGFQACGNLSVVEGRCLHGFAVKSGIGCQQALQSSLLSMYSKCGTPEEAYQSFSEVVNKDLLSWTSIISICARFGYVTQYVSLFREMQDNGICPDSIILSCMLCGFSNSLSSSEGKTFHGLIIRRQYILDEVVCNALLTMYCKFGKLSFAEKLFNVNEHNRASWNAMVFGYGKIGQNAKCIEFFREMQILGIQPDLNSLSFVISSCTRLKAIYMGRSVHCNFIKCFMHENVSITNSLIDMYGKCGNMTIAWRIFQRMERVIISWNTLMSSYIHLGHHEVAITLFDKLIDDGMEPNMSTYVIVLSACSSLASLQKGERIHSDLEERGFKLNLPLNTALVDMYAKCGQLEKSRRQFDLMEEQDTISWNVMISGYGMHGHAEAAMELFEQMEASCVYPNDMTFLALLSACAHAGLVKEGKYVFGRMQYYSVKPNLKHYACMVDLLGRSGNLQEAKVLVLSMPISPDGGVWGSLLGACQIHNETEMGIRIAKYAIESDPENDGYYIMLSNMYSSIGLWDEAENVRRMMNQKCSMAKTVGWSAL